MNIGCYAILVMKWTVKNTARMAKIPYNSQVDGSRNDSP